MKAFLLACVLVLIGFPAYAQVPTVPANTPFSVVSDHVDVGTPATGFRCYVDTIKIGNDLPLSARVNGKFTCAMPGQTIGNHTVQTSAFNAFGETRSATFAVTVGGPPAGPTNLQIMLQIAVATDGTATLLAMKVETLP